MKKYKIIIVSVLSLLILIGLLFLCSGHQETYIPVNREKGIRGEWVYFEKDTITHEIFGEDGILTEIDYKPTGKYHRYRKTTGKASYEVTGNHIVMEDEEAKLGMSLRFAHKGTDTIVTLHFDWLPMCADTMYLMNDRHRNLIKRLEELSE